MDEALQRDVAARMVAIFRERGVETVLVGSTAIIALELAPVTSKDADLLAPNSLTLDAARALMARIGSELGLRLVERGWGVVSLVKESGGEEVWRADLLVPEAGPIPPPVATLIRRRAVPTDIGPAAIPEHVMAMKGVAHGDSLGKGAEDEALKYATDLVRLRDALAEPQWGLVSEVLHAYPLARARMGAAAIDEAFKTDLEKEFADDP